jgi:dolichol-phosphate mannosyltransferase
MNIRGDLLNRNVDLNGESRRLIESFGSLNPNLLDLVNDLGTQAHDPAEGMIDCSFVIPLKDEQATLGELCGRIKEQFGPETRFEIIFVDDGSTDQSWHEIKSLCEQNRGVVRGLRFRRNAGKASALTAGFRAARGGIIFTMDADLQDDPKEVHRFLAKLNEGYDLVSGWKRVRHDPWHKVLPSRVFNWMLSRLSRTRLHDHNCGFKCYRAEVPKGLTLYGEMHRMIPALAAIEGYRAAELEVEHHPRKKGRSKYGFERYLRGMMDMLTVCFFRKYRERPAHFVGGISLFCGVLGVGLLLGGAVSGLDQWSGSTLFLGGTVMLGTAVLGFSLGMISELVIRGGLQTDWRLPIVEDTQVSGRPSTATAPRVVTAIPLSYQVETA